MGELVRRVLDGHEKIAEWSAEDPSSLEAAQRLLKREMEAGYLAVLADDDENEPVTDLPPDADLVILTMPAGGG
jgi:hypothetical protein